MGPQGERGLIGPQGLTGEMGPQGSAANPASRGRKDRWACPAFRATLDLKGRLDWLGRQGQRGNEVFDGPAGPAGMEPLGKWLAENIYRKGDLVGWDGLTMVGEGWRRSRQGTRARATAG